MFEQKTRNKISFQGIILSVQPRSNLYGLLFDGYAFLMNI